jgi:hypothetical protein
METSGLCGANLVFRNKQGEVVLALKRKVDDRTGNLFYVFELHLDRVPTEELVRFQQAWDATKFFFFVQGIPLYDIEEITEKILQKVKKPPRKTKEIAIRVRDHASGMMHTLVVAAHPAEGEENE